MNQESGAGEFRQGPPHWGATDLRFWQWKQPSRDSKALKAEADLDLPSMVLKGCGLDLADPLVVAVLNGVSRKDACFQANSMSMKYSCAVAEAPAPCCMYKTLMDAGLLSELKGRRKAMFTVYVNRMNHYFPDMEMNNFWLERMRPDIEYYDECEIHMLDTDEANYQTRLTAWASAEYFITKFDDARGKYNMYNDTPPTPPTTEKPFAHNVYKKRQNGFVSWLPGNFITELRVVDRMYTEIHTWCFIAFLIKMGSKNAERFMAVLEHSKVHLKGVQEYERFLKKRKLEEIREEEEAEREMLAKQARENARANETEEEKEDRLAAQMEADWDEMEENDWD